MTKDQVKEASLKYFDLVGIARAARPQSISFYEKWLEAGKNGKMEYLRRHLDKKRSPELLLKNAKSWIVVALYYDTDEPLSIDEQTRLAKKEFGFISRYARGEDYHDVIGQKLKLVIQELKAAYPEHEFLECVDFRAVLERDAAYTAGLGWIGKNTCLINQKMGSFLFLAEILTTLELEPDAPGTDHCGNCDRCLKACPTGALTQPYDLDARLCISYWTIENDSPPPQELAKKFGTNVFGCDICQDVCPWNQKRRRAHLPPANPNHLHEFDLRDFITWPEVQIETLIKNTALERAGAKHLLQNAQQVLKNLEKKEVI